MFVLDICCAFCWPDASVETYHIQSQTVVVCFSRDRILSRFGAQSYQTWHCVRFSCFSKHLQLWKCVSIITRSIWHSFQSALFVLQSQIHVNTKKNIRSLLTAISCAVKIDRNASTVGSSSQWPMCCWIAAGLPGCGHHLGHFAPTVTLLYLLSDNSRWIHNGSIFSFIRAANFPVTFLS